MSRPRLTEPLHDSQYYSAAFISGPHGGLCITRKRKQGGILAPDPGGVWREAFATALDSTERDALCRGALNGG